jgi:flagellar motor protein MotB
MNRPFLEDEEPPARVPGWALTYIDLLWLLLLFFILQAAVSAIGTGHRFRDLTAALKKRFGTEAVAVARNEQKRETAADAKDRAQYGETIREGFDDSTAALKRSLTLRGAIYFPDGEVNLQGEQKQLLQAVAEVVGRTSVSIEIRGEATENATEAGKAGAAAADQAYARCAAARNYLIKLGIEPRRLRIAIGDSRRPAGEKPRVTLYSVTEIAAEKSVKKR